MSITTPFKGLEVHPDSCWPPEKDLPKMFLPQEGAWLVEVRKAGGYAEYLRKVRAGEIVTQFDGMEIRVQG